MDREQIITKAGELKESCRLAQGYESFYQELLDDYAAHVWALKSINDEYVWQELLETQEAWGTIGKQLPNVSDETFNEYCFLTNLLAILLQPMKNN